MEMRVAWLRPNNILFAIFIVFLIIDSLLGGYFIYKYIPTLTSYIYQDQSKSPLINNLFENSGKKLNPDEYKNYIDTVSQVAMKTSTVVVTNCSLSPRVIKANTTSSLVFKNAGSTSTFLRISQQKPVIIEANQTATISLSFVTTIPAVVSIGCTGSRKAAGIIYIAPTSTHD